VFDGKGKKNAVKVRSEKRYVPLVKRSRGRAGIRGDNPHLRDASRHPLPDVVLGRLRRDDIMRIRIGMAGEMTVETAIETGTGTGITMGIDAKGGADATTDLDFLYCIYLTSSLYYSPR
jgi:hypothetical protein